MGLFSKPRAVGLEFDSEEVRAIELCGSARAPTITAVGSIPLPEGTVQDGVVVRPDEAASALRHLWSEAGFSGREVVLGVANQGVLVRFATFPKVPENKIGSMVRYQAQEYLPLPISGAVLDYAVISEKLSDSGPVLEVLLVAARRDMLDGFLSALAAARLTPADIDVTPLALVRLLPDAEQSGTVAMVNVENGLTTILVLSYGVPRLTRLLPTGLQEAARLAACSLDELVTAVDQKQQTWQDTALAAWGEGLAGEVVASIGYYQKQPGAGPVDKIILSGRGARAGGLTARLQEDTGLPVEVLQAVDGIVWPDRPFGARTGELADFAVALSLARRGLET